MKPPKREWWEIVFYPKDICTRYNQSPLWTVHQLLKGEMMYKIWIYISSIETNHEVFFEDADSIEEARRIKERLELVFTMLDADLVTRVRIRNEKGETVH